MEAIDGNAVAGSLFEVFGVEMTTSTGTCRHCGTPAQIAELRVYSCAPGSVVRCRTCGNVVMVVMAIRGATQVDMRGFELGTAAGS